MQSRRLTNWADIVELIAPQGRFGLIDDPAVLDAMPLKTKAVSLHWELIFTRSLFGTPDMAEQGRLFNEVAALAHPFYRDRSGGSDRSPDSVRSAGSNWARRGARQNRVGRVLHKTFGAMTHLYHEDRRCNHALRADNSL
ncbi:MAG: hypothetical protein ACFB12_04980 [Leptolyngbyaceae cyanobacterium]